MMAAKKAKKAAPKKPRDGSSLEDMKYTKKWHDEKIADFTARLEKAKIEAPYTVKSIEKDIAWLKQSRRHSVKVAPPLPPGGNPGARYLSPGRGIMLGGGPVNRGK
jgi:hypothetical protein